MNLIFNSLILRYINLNLILISNIRLELFYSTIFVFKRIKFLHDSIPKSVAGQLPKFRYGNKSSHLRKKRNKFLFDSLRSFTFLWRLYHLSIRITGVSRSPKTAGEPTIFSKIFNFFYKLWNFIQNHRPKK